MKSGGFWHRYGGWIALLTVMAGILIGTPSVTRGGDVSQPEEDRKPVSDEKTDLLSVGSYEELFEMLTRYAENKEFAGSGMGGIDVEMAEHSMDFAGSSSGAAAPSMDMGVGGYFPEDKGGQDFSATNTQEENVDEADIIKTDGKYIYHLDDRGVIRIIDAGDMEVVSEIPFEGKEQSRCMEMYVDGDTLQLIWEEHDFLSVQGEITLWQTEGRSGVMPLKGEDSDGTESSENTESSESAESSGNTGGESVRTYYSLPVRVTVASTYDISDREMPRKTGSCRQDGRYVTSRRNGGYLYLFTSYSPRRLEGQEQKEYYVPRAGGEFLPCAGIYIPGSDRQGAFGGTSYLVGTSVSQEMPDRPKDRMAVVSGGEIFYVSEKNIYTAVSYWEDNQGVTDLVRLGYEDGYFVAGSSGRVPGMLNNNFSMNEYKDYLRVVTTQESYSERKNASLSEVLHSRTNGLYVLDRNLEITGKVDKLAEDETIESARFMGDVGYFVTYRNTDPLFSVDLKDPENPKVLGELKITGFSEYLHFYGKNKLLGIGWETDPDTGGRIGMKCFMFDISDPYNVKETDKLVLADVDHCAALDEYKGILVNPQKNLFGFAYLMYEDVSWEEQFYYGVFSYGEEEGFKNSAHLLADRDMAESYDDYMQLRGLYIGDTFYLAGNYGVESYDMSDGFRKTGSLFW